MLPRTYSYTTADGVARRFREVFWPDMRRLAALIPLINLEEPCANFWDITDQQAPGDKPADVTSPAAATLPFADLCEIIFAKDYCDQPLTRDEIVNGRHISQYDVRPLAEIAAGVATLDTAKKAPAAEPTLT